MSEDIVGQIKDIKGRTWQEAFYIQTKAFLEKNSEHLKEIERLKAEVERLTAFTTRTIIPNEQLQAENARLKAEVERLRLIGDEINMWGVVAPYVVPPCIDKYSAKEGKQP
jgi:uncharacterized protein YdaT